jgi:NADPH-dependent 7-cyano-7-deazaguanine reductase QueF
VAACQPHALTVVGDFNVRGGLKSIITAKYER